MNDPASTADAPIHHDGDETPIRRDDDDARAPLDPREVIERLSALCEDFVREFNAPKPPPPIADLWQRAAQAAGLVVFQSIAATSGTHAAGSAPQCADAGAAFADRLVGLYVARLDALASGKDPTPSKGPAPARS